MPVAAGAGTTQHSKPAPADLVKLSKLVCLTLCSQTPSATFSPPPPSHYTTICTNVIIVKTGNASGGVFLARPMGGWKSATHGLVIGENFT